MADIIELANVTKAYKLGDETLNALDNVNLRIQAGDLEAITGPSGSGKPTLANILSGLDRSFHRSVVVDDGDLSQLSYRKLSDCCNLSRM